MSSHMFVVFVAIAAIVPGTALATEFIVGDDSGWTVGYNYTAWTAGKKFVVGDTLVFKYPAGAHNVFRVNGTSFQNCTKPPPNEALTSGNDTIVLAVPGSKWYICGVGQHCANGQKLAITVEGLAPAPTPAIKMAPLPSPPLHAMAAYSSSAAKETIYHQLSSLAMIGTLGVMILAHY